MPLNRSHPKSDARPPIASGDRPKSAGRRSAPKPVGHGSIRMEPVFMVLSESAAIAAGVALSRNEPVQEVTHDQLEGPLKEATQKSRATHSGID